jgi:thiol:disulfide interchange protein DsbD
VAPAFGHIGRAALLERHWCRGDLPSILPTATVHLRLPLPSALRLSTLWRLPSPRRAALLALLAALLLTLPAQRAGAQAQAFSGGEEELPAVLATFETKLEPATARPGEHVRLIVSARLAQGWYTYSVVPQEDEFAPPPTRIQVQPDGLELEGPVYETNPVQKKDEVFGIPLAFHPNAARFYQNLRVPPGFAAGSAAVSADIRYQVCNNRICTPPRSEQLAAALRVEAGPVRPPYAFLQRTVDFVQPDGTFRIDASTLEGALAQGLGGFLLLAAGFGLLALLTPCVFPMIPVTMSFFMGAGERGRGNVLGLALLFGAGIVGAATTLGLALTFFLGASGVSQFATSPWVNLAVAGFFALFALSLLGLLELGLPSGLLARMDGLSRGVQGPLAVLLMGVAFAATSFTCTMPFVGTLLVAATQGQVFWPVVGMLVFSSVFALPFFLLALFPRYVMRLRGRGGNWLVQLKVVLGLLELGAALKFVSNADVIWQWGFFDREVVLALWAALAALCALVLLGLVPWPGVEVHARRPLRLAMGGAFLLLALYTAAGLTGRELNSFTESYLPPDLGDPAKAALRSGVSYVDAQSVHELPWHPTLAAGLAEARRTGKPVFIDFTGYTCVNCRWMEKRIFAAQPVFEAFRDGFVLVQLYTDGGEHAEENQRLQVERFRTLALPYYVVLSPDNAVLARHAGIVPTPGEFLELLQRGRRQLTAGQAKPS